MKLPSSVSLSLYFLFFLFFFCFKSVNAFIYRLSCCCCCCCCCLVRIPHDVSSRMFIIRMCLLPVDDLWRPIPRRFRRTLISRSSASAIVAVAASMASCARPESITIQLKISQLIELIHSWNGRNQQLWGGGQHQLILYQRWDWITYSWLIKQHQKKQFVKNKDRFTKKKIKPSDW